MLREVKNSLNRGKPSTGYRLAMFVFTHEKEAMMFYYCDAPRTDLLTLMREFIRTLEDG